MDTHITDPALLTLSAAAKLIAARRLSSVELTQACLQRVEKYEAQIQAFVTLTAERAIEQAQEADRDIAAGRYRGPMHGIPFGLKDVYDTAGVLTTAHSRILERNVPTHTMQAQWPDFMKPAVCCWANWHSKW